MAQIITEIGEVVVAMLKLAVIMFLGLIFLVIFLTVWSMPLHNFDLWRLERNFNTTVPLYHPLESFLLQKKTYLGGPAEHGSLVCSFFAGELRAAYLTKESIRAAYQKNAFLNVLFFDEEHWTMESPLGDWWDEWYGNSLLATSSTVYFVYAARENVPFAGDIRCDD